MNDCFLYIHTHRGGSVRKSFLTNADTPVQAARGRGQVRPGQGRVLFGGNEGLGFSPQLVPQQSSSGLSLDLGEEKLEGSSSDDSEEKEEDDDEWELGSTQGDDDDEEDDDDDDSSAAGRRQQDGGAAALYASYFLSPQNRLPINHPDHDYSFQFQGR